MDIKETGKGHRIISEEKKWEVENEEESKRRRGRRRRQRKNIGIQWRCFVQDKRVKEISHTENRNEREWSR